MEKDRKNTSLAVKPMSKGLSIISNMEDFDRIVDFIANSKTYNANFLVNVDQEKEDGTIIKVREVDRNAIATCLMLGSELGFKPMESILLGTRLDANAIVKVHRGRDLGVSAVSAMQKIYVFNSGDGRENVYTSIDVIHKCLIDNKVTREILENGHKSYIDYKTGQIIDEINSITHYVVSSTVTPQQFATAVSSGKIIVIINPNRRAVVKLTRHYSDGRKEVVAVPYTLQQAIDADLYPGTKTDGGVCEKGKKNWIAHPETHLVKMSTMIGARMIIGDALLGTYIPEELPDNLIEETTAEEVD